MEHERLCRGPPLGRLPTAGGSVRRRLGSIARIPSALPPCGSPRRSGGRGILENLDPERMAEGPLLLMGCSTRPAWIARITT